MATRTSGGFNPARGGRRATYGGRKSRRSGGFMVRFTIVVAAGTALLWFVDRPVSPDKLGAESVQHQPGVGAG